MPVFLFGHSMGGECLHTLYSLFLRALLSAGLLAAAVCLLQAEKIPRPFSGVILSGPALAAGESIGTVTILIARLISKVRSQF